MRVHTFGKPRIGRVRTVIFETEVYQHDFRIAVAVDCEFVPAGEDA